MRLKCIHMTRHSEHSSCLQFVGWVIVIANLQEMTSRQHHKGMVPLQEDNPSMTSQTVMGYQPRSISSVAIAQYPELQRAARVPTSFYQARYQPTDNLAALGHRYNDYGGASRKCLLLSLEPVLTNPQRNVYKSELNRDLHLNRLNTSIEFI